MLRAEEASTGEKRLPDEVTIRPDAYLYWEAFLLLSRSRHNIITFPPAGSEPKYFENKSPISVSDMLVYCDSFGVSGYYDKKSFMRIIQALDSHILSR